MLTALTLQTRMENSAPAQHQHGNTSWPFQLAPSTAFSSSTQLLARLRRTVLRFKIRAQFVFSPDLGTLVHLCSQGLIKCNSGKCSETLAVKTCWRKFMLERAAHSTYSIANNCNLVSTVSLGQIPNCWKQVYLYHIDYWCYWSHIIYKGWQFH